MLILLISEFSLHWTVLFTTENKNEYIYIYNFFFNNSLEESLGLDPVVCYASGASYLTAPPPPRPNIKTLNVFVLVLLIVHILKLHLGN